ncbi:hypothetical protein LJ737_17485 [Hymenobacter sp. 15J16-1T3B]|uniref:hypothetical protein n=1 Tax=Hymenobacter sp. 15J16-1T3B TaxID=2886941 RepID=UPI001D11B474|nr:hypothetical protein [Hymenobacter sp. 15J16-1T3B]MCC3159040.1 hypothetical protein [Hymenobacter sp. 15J16-1T3B]
MLLDLLLAGVLALSLLPLLTGYCACSYGRSFWLWFALGWVLPLLSFYLLLLVLRRRELQPGEQLLAEARDILAAAEAAETARVRALLPRNCRLADA